MTTPDKPSAAATLLSVALIDACEKHMTRGELPSIEMVRRAFKSARIAVAEREAVERLVKAADELKKHVHHKLNCAVTRDTCDPCTCGLHAALDELKSAREGVKP